MSSLYYFGSYLSYEIAILSTIVETCKKSFFKKTQEKKTYFYKIFLSY